MYLAPLMDTKVFWVAHKTVKKGQHFSDGESLSFSGKDPQPLTILWHFLNVLFFAISLMEDVLRLGSRKNIFH